MQKIPLERQEACASGNAIVFNSYSIVIDGDERPPDTAGRQIVTARSHDEAVKYLRLLGENARLHLSPEFRRNNPDESRILLEAGPERQDGEAPFDIITAAGLMRQLPLDLIGLRTSRIALMPEDPLPPRIDKSLVHKRNEANVLISVPFTTGWLRYFNMFLTTDEIRFDHESEHVQGLIISEAMRQAGIACTHLQGMPTEGNLVLLSFRTNFISFIECSAPIIIRAYDSFNPRDSDSEGDASLYIEVFQWGRFCAACEVSTIACASRQRQQEFNDRLTRIASRYKSQYVSKIGSIHPTFC